MAIEKSFAPFKAVIQVPNDADIAGRNALLDFLKSATEEDIINVTLIEMPLAISQNGAGFSIRKLNAIGLKEKVLYDR